MKDIVATILLTASNKDDSLKKKDNLNMNTMSKNKTTKTNEDELEIKQPSLKSSTLPEVIII